MMNLACRQAGYEVKIYNVLGEIIQHSIFNNLPDGSQVQHSTFSLNFSAGIYFVELISEKGVMVKKMEIRK